jgi:hypothetical protein
MPDFEKIEKNIILANLVSSWASEYRVLDHPYIDGLLRTLRNNRNLGVWANMSHMTLLPEPLNLKDLPIQRVINFLNAIRNGLVLLPLAFTWLAVGKASLAFQLFIQQNSSPTQNFLDFWQNGYGLLGDFWRFSNMATWDSVFVFLIIILTLTIHQVSYRAENIWKDEQLKIDQERLEMAWAVSDYFHSKQLELTEKVNSDLIKAIGELNKSPKRVVKPKARNSR